MVVGAVEDVADAKKILQVDVVPLYLQSLLQHIDGVHQTIALEMSVDLLDGALNESVALDFLLHSLHNVVDFFMILAGRIVLSVDGLLEFQRFVMGSVVLMGR